MTPTGRGRYAVRTARGGADIAAVRRLRAAAFGPAGPDEGDPLETRARNVVIGDRRLGRIAGCFRLLPLATGADVADSYSARFYDLTRLSHHPGPMVELGRFCIDPDARDPDILRAAWAAVTAHVDAVGVRMLFGCTSFRGTDPAPYAQALALLAQRHLAPPDWAPGRRAARTVPLTANDFEPRRALREIPPLLRTYLAMGGRVSDHAVVDAAMNTLHVFTGLEIDTIPESRKRLLRADARALDGDAPAG